jgi:hypothetical protein
VKIILHILAKDLRRHWIEIALYLLACTAWVWQTAHPSSWMWIPERDLVPILPFLLWFILTVRVVQGESLVGDREFWMTRPYRWGHLMAAKAIFLVLCLNLPMSVSEVALIHAADLPLSWSLVPGLLFLQIMLAFFFTFPAAALASITESFVQWGLAVVGIAVFYMMVSWIPWDKLPPGLEGGENVSSVLGMALIAPALAFVLLWQFARRRVWPARLVFAAALLVVPLVILLSGTPLIRSIAYPRLRTAPSFQLAISQNDAGGRSYNRYDIVYPREAHLQIPVIAVQMDPDTIVDLEGLRVTFNGDNGWRWQSAWINGGPMFTRDSPQGDLDIPMPPEVADRLAAAHARASVELAFGLDRMSAPIPVNTASSRFSVPGSLVCRWFNNIAPGDRAPFISFSGLECTAPLRLPEVIEFRIDSAASTCPLAENESPLPAGHFATNLMRGTSLPADFDPDPVHKTIPNFGYWRPLIPSDRDPKDHLTASPCRGTPMTVRTGASEGRSRATFDLGSIGAEKRPNGNSGVSGSIFRIAPQP